MSYEDRMDEEEAKLAAFYAEQENKNLVDQLVKYIRVDPRISEDWCISLVCGMIGSVVGDGVELTSKLGRLIPSTQTIFIAPSGWFKTVPIKKCRIVLRNLTNILFQEYLVKNGLDEKKYDEAKAKCDATANRKKQEDEYQDNLKIVEKFEGGKDQFDLLPSPKGSIEGWTKFFKSHKIGFMMGDEFTSMLKGSSTKDYMADIFEFMSTLYDGEVQSSTTISRGKEEATGLCISFCSATTPYVFSLLKDKSSFRQGFSNRILWLMDLSIPEFDRGQAYVREADFLMDDPAADVADKKLQHAAEILRRVMNFSNMRILASDDANQKIDRIRVDFQELTIKALEESIDSVEASYYNRAAENFLRLAMVRCIGRYAVSQIREDGEYMYMSGEDVLWAEKRIKIHIENYKAVLREVSLNMDKEVKSYKDSMESILKLIKDSGGRTTSQAVAHKFWWTTEDTAKVLATMREIGLIEIQEERINPENMEIIPAGIVAARGVK